MLRISSEGRAAALDMRLIDPSLPDDPNSKINMAVENIHRIFTDTAEQKLTQLIFCDLSTPNPRKFNIYDDIRGKLMARGIPKEQIAFIHEYDTNKQKEALREKVRNGDIRILMGSSEKMGEGMNVQNKLLALHHLDVPWTPKDLDQRDGRALRPLNENETVMIFRYATEGSFDAYSWQTVERKWKFEWQIMSGKSPSRTAEDIDAKAFSYAEIKMLTSANPLVKTKLEVDMEVERLKILKLQFDRNLYTLQDKVMKTLPKNISYYSEQLKLLTADTQTLDKTANAEFSMKIGGKVYDNRTDAGERIMKFSAGMKLQQETAIGEYRGFALKLRCDADHALPYMVLSGAKSYRVDMGDSAVGNAARLDNALKEISKQVVGAKQGLETEKKQLEASKAELDVPFPHADRLADLLKQQAELTIQLDLGRKDVVSDCMDEEINQGDGERENDGQTIYQKNYALFKRLAGDILTGDCEYMRFESDDAKNYIVAQSIGNNKVSFTNFPGTHLIRSPEFVFKFSNTAKTVTAQHSINDRSREYFDLASDPSLESELNDNLHSYLKEAASGAYSLTSINEFEDEDEDEM